ncbi:MAG: DUF4386 family protein [Chloroflexota bacterium]
MTSERLILGMALIALPIAFNVLFTALAKMFEYPDILRHETSDILSRFTAGGQRLLLTWWLFMATAIALVPVAALVAAHLAPAGIALATASLALGVTAGLVQAMGLARWPFLVPILAARYDGATSEAERAATRIVFDAAHRYLGVAVGEHLGYLTTGAWTIVVGLAIVATPGSIAILGVAGVVLGALLAAGSLEFVGRPGERGWPFAEKLVPVAYLGWSLWLLALGIAILAGAA